MAVTVARPAVTFIRRRSRPADATGGGGAEPCGSERGPAGEARDDQSHDAPAHTDHDRFDRGQPDQLAPAGAAGTKQRLLLPAAHLPGRNDSGGQQARQHRGGQPEEQEQHLRVGGIRAGGAQTRTEVVPDQRRASAAGLEIVSRGGHHTVGGRRIARQRVIECGMYFGGDEVGTCGGQRVEQGVPSSLVDQDHVVRRRDRLRRRRCADGLEQRVRLR
nr:hypothetical protein [Rhodococcus sp. AJR001]